MDRIVKGVTRPIGISNREDAPRARRLCRRIEATEPQGGHPCLRQLLRLVRSIHGNRCWTRARGARYGLYDLDGLERMILAPRGDGASTAGPWRQGALLRTTARSHSSQAHQVDRPHRGTLHNSFGTPPALRRVRRLIVSHRVSGKQCKFWWGGPLSAAGPLAGSSSAVRNILRCPQRRRGACGRDQDSPTNQHNTARKLLNPKTAVLLGTAVSRLIEQYGLKGPAGQPVPRVGQKHQRHFVMVQIIQNCSLQLDAWDQSGSSR